MWFVVQMEGRSFSSPWFGVLFVWSEQVRLLIETLDPVQRWKGLWETGSSREEGSFTSLLESRLSTIRV